MIFDIFQFKCYLMEKLNNHNTYFYGTFWQLRWSQSYLQRGYIYKYFLKLNKNLSYIFSFNLIGIDIEKTDGAKRTRTADPLHAMQVLYQLSYGPKYLHN